MRFEAHARDPAAPEEVGCVIEFHHAINYCSYSVQGKYQKNKRLYRSSTCSTKNYYDNRGIVHCICKPLAARERVGV